MVKSEKLKPIIISRDISVWATLSPASPRTSTPTHVRTIKLFVSIFVYSSHRKDSICVLNEEQNITQLVLVSLYPTGNEGNHVQFVLSIGGYREHALPYNPNRTVPSEKTT